MEKKYPSVIPQLATVRHGVYDRKAAEVLAFASTWTYSDVRTFANVMARRGLLGCHAAALTIANDALLVNTSAIVVQSADHKVAILSFRGTEPRNAINWLTNASTRMDAFPAGGHVHGGFQRAVRTLWEPLRQLMIELHWGTLLCDALAKLDRQWASTCPDTRAQRPCRCEPSPTAVDAAGAAGGDNVKLGKLEALYITGHSLGAALAVIAAALIETDDQLTGLRSALRGVYTYGQPMVGDSTFATEFDEKLGKKLFRHVYSRDIVPRMPPLTVDRYVHFGRQYNSTPTGWKYEPKPMRQAFTVGLSNALGVAAWVSQQLSPISWIRMPFSWGDHMPLNYLRTSMTAAPGAELD
ncbi:lipase family protein [Sorangium sp. So ce117]|uniref:lipase family protein n=1 Tax=Sorangium sp. So ce117 TaxID=3133277 RepID=UPI003F6452CC